MSMTVPLPSGLQRRLFGVGLRVRWLQTLRGLSLLVVLLGLIAGAAMAVDYALDATMPSLVRSVILGVWTSIGLTLLVARVFRPAVRPVDLTALAALVEQHHPDLAERLTSSVELCRHADEANGAPALIELLVRETERRTSGLHFGRAVTGRSTRLLTLLALAVAGLLAVPAAVAPATYAHLAERFFFPWLVAAAPADFAFAVQPGDSFAARGRPLTVRVTLSPAQPLIPLPETAALVVAAADGTEARHDMTADPEQEGVYGVTFRLLGDVTYRVEAGNATSDSYRLTAVVPVELAADSPQVTVTPPDYAAAVLDPETYPGIIDFAALQHSTIEFHLSFTRPAVAAALLWLPAGEKKDAQSAQVVPMQLGDDGTTATLTRPADAGGSYRLLLDAEHGIRTERDGATITVKPDQPPALLKYTGREGTQTTRPDDRLPLEVRLADDIGVAAAHLLFQVNEEKKVREEPIALDGANTRAAVGRHQLLLAGKVKDGDLLRYRIRFQDNLPPALGGPHVVYHPADGWFELRIRAGQKSVREQDILAQRDDINQKLDAILAQLKLEQRRVLTFRQLSDKQVRLSSRSQDILQGVTALNQKTEQELRDLSRSIVDDPALQELSRKTDDVANQEMRRAGQHLQDTRDPKTGTDARHRNLQSTENELASALRKLTDLKALNDKLAADRLDQMKVETLADRQQGLAEKAAELAAKHPVADPEAQKLADEIKREQDDVARQLRDLTEKNDLLRKALEQARAERLQQAAEQARELAREQRDLARASDQTEKTRAAEQLAALARKQQELAREADDLARDTANPAKANFARPLQTDDAAKAAESLKSGEAERAMQEQDRSARELDRLGHDLARALRLGDDPREAARQLARLEQELAGRTRTEAKQPDEKRLAELAREQETIRQATEKLSVPPERPEARADRLKAAAELSAAQKALERKDANAALSEMAKAQQTLRDLAAKLPSLEERRHKARAALQEMQREQEAIARRLQEAAQDPTKAENKLNEAMQKQARITEELARLDTPNQEERRARAREAAEQATRDLAARRSDDQPASQARVRREMERLAQALTGQKPADEKAAELADRQRALAARAEKAANDPTTPQNKVEELKREQQKLADETGWLHAPDAATAKREAAEAARKAADDTTRAASPGKEARQAMEQAARKLDALAQALSGDEKAAQKADRLARAQKDLAEHPPREAWVESQRQKEVGQEAKEMRTPDSARTETAKAREALRQAEEAKPTERAAARRQAAEALKDLADKLAKSPSSERPDTPAETRKQAARLAREQARLAETTRQAAEAAKQPGKASPEETNRALEKGQAEQQRLTEQAAQMKPGPNEAKPVEQARTAMEQARQALAKKDAAAAAGKQQEAARALQQAAGQTSPLPTHDQVERARILARDQRELREAVQRANEQVQTERRADNAPNRDNPAGKLAQQQAEVARQAAQLARNVASEQGEQSKPAARAAEASQSARAAARNLQTGATRPAQEAGKRTAEELRRLADELAKTPRGSDAKGDTLQSTRQLAQQQEELNQQMQPLAGDRAAERAQQQARQTDLAQQTADLGRQLDQAAQASGPTQPAARTAAQNAQAATNSMQAARNQAQQGNQPSTQAQREMAANNLDQLARQAEQAAARSQPGQPMPGQQAGQSIQQAQNQIGQAQNQLNQNQPSSARQSMSQAAQSLANAAQQLAQAKAQQPGRPTGPSDPGERGASEGGAADTRPIPKELAPHAGKRWGELPGELRTRIVQQMKARYGDDYARMIKLYFEQLADTRRR